MQSPGAPPPLPVPRSGGGAAVFSRGKCFAFGGEIDSNVANSTTGLNTLGTFARVDVFDVAKNTWTVGRVCFCLTCVFGDVFIDVVGPTYELTTS